MNEMLSLIKLFDLTASGAWTCYGYLLLLMLLIVVIILLKCNYTLRSTHYTYVSSGTL